MTDELNVGTEGLTLDIIILFAGSSKENFLISICGLRQRSAGELIGAGRFLQ